MLRLVCWLRGHLWCHHRHSTMPIGEVRIIWERWYRCVRCGAECQYPDSVPLTTARDHNPERVG